MAATLVRALAVASLVMLGLCSCSDTTRSASSFCEQLAVVTGPQGAEVNLGVGDPERVGAIVAELHDLLDRAPDDIATTTSTLVDFFQDYQRAARDERRDLLSANEERIVQASADLDAYALKECGLFLQRAAPTAIASSDPGIEVAPE